MTDFAIDRSQTYARVDTRWRTSDHGNDSAQPGSLDLTKFIEGTHYNIGGKDDNVIPSGVAVQYNAATKLYEPWIPAGAAPIAGYINDNQGIDLYRRQGVAKSTQSSFALFLHGIIEVAFLPIAAQRAAVKTAESAGSFIYV